jgi:TolB-like protein/Flp pilus assembly protein TadD
LQNFFAELKRRNVVRAAILYAVSAWLLMQIVDVMFPALHLPEWTVTLIAALLTLLFPLVLIFAWVFEVTPEGLKRTEGVAPAPSATQHTSRRMEGIILAALFLALGLLLYQLVTSHREPAQPVDSAPPVADGGPRTPADLKSVAVLPFVNMSNDPDNEFFSDGISEELLDALVKLAGLRVPSRTSSFAFKGKNVDVIDIGRALNVDHVVEGSVRKSGNQVRVTAQLIDLRTDSHLWSQTYDRELDDIFAVQDEIARGIAQALEIQLGLGAGDHLVTQSTSSMQAYELYLRAGQLWQLRRSEAVSNAEAILLRAIELDPDFAQAWARLAAVYMVTSSWSEAELAEKTARAEMAARRALQLTPSLAQPRAVLANIAAGQQNYAESERLFREAIELEPSDPITHLWYAILLNGLGRQHEASLEYRLAVTLDPLAPIGLSWLAAYHIQSGSLSAALDAAQQSMAIGYGYGHILAYQVLARLGQFDRAEAELREGLKHDGIDAAFVDVLMAAWRNPSPSEAAIKAVAATLALPDQIYTYADLLANDALFDGFKDLRGTQLYLSLPVLWDVTSTKLRRDPRFHALVQELRLLDYWRASDQWPDLCRPAGESIECDVAKEAHP